jgi:hypothetical protein
MTTPPIIDAGPSLNVLSINRERLLIATMGKLSAPESVQAEVLRKAAQDARFRAAASTWRKLTPTYIAVLSDDPTEALSRAVSRITDQRMDERLLRSKDLGETMVIAHASLDDRGVSPWHDRVNAAEVRRAERRPSVLGQRATAPP